MKFFDEARLPDGTKKRRHTNNKGYRRIKNGKTVDYVVALAERLGIPYVTRAEAERQTEKDKGK